MGVTATLPAPVRAREVPAKPSFLEAWHMNVRVNQVHDDWSVAKAREECIPFTFTLATGDSRRGPDLKAQESFVKKLNTLTAKQARAAAKRAKARA